MPRINISIGIEQDQWLKTLPRTFKLSAFVREKLDELRKEYEQEVIKNAVNKETK